MKDLINSINTDYLADFIDWARGQDWVEAIRLEVCGRHLRARVIPESYYHNSNATSCTQLLRFDVGSHVLMTEAIDIRSSGVITLLIKDISSKIR